MGASNSHPPFGPSQQFWGAIPAVDAVRLSFNEGEAYDKELSLLFAGTVFVLPRRALLRLTSAQPRAIFET
jgi:hypothetical protein